jgi:hypothetical protein
MAMSAADNDGASLLFEQAIALYESAGNTHAAARVSSWLAFAEQTRAESKRESRMERAYEVVGGDAPDADLALLLTRLGQAHWFAGHPEQARSGQSRRSTSRKRCDCLRCGSAAGWRRAASSRRAVRRRPAACIGSPSTLRWSTSCRW